MCMALRLGSGNILRTSLCALGNMHQTVVDKHQPRQTHELSLVRSRNESRHMLHGYPGNTRPRAAHLIVIPPHIALRRLVRQDRAEGQATPGAEGHATLDEEGTDDDGPIVHWASFTGDTNLRNVCTVNTCRPPCSCKS